MSFTFLPMTIVVSVAVLLTYCFINLSLWINFILIFLTTFIGIIFRKSKIPYVDTFKIDGEMYLSPVHGIVEDVRQNVTIPGTSEIGHEIRVSISIFEEKGLYLPANAEVSYLKAFNGRKVPRNSDSKEFYVPVDELSHTDMVLSLRSSHQTLLRFIDCKYSIRPYIWLKSGDRGRGAACFGHYPFGGTLLIYIPQNSDILVFNKERVVPGHTVIAAIKGFK
ncbi:MAG: hypothetical protein AB7I27_05230 [Bacteriovoracaceae bacterium]